MPIPFPFDFKNPDYIEVFEWRLERYNRIQNNPGCLSSLKTFYKKNPAQFIIDWGQTYDPRNVEVGLPAYCPFILFQKQEDWINWFLERWKNKEPGITEKSREMGLSWLMISLSVTLCLFLEGLSVGFGSRKQEYVDKLNDPKSILQKGRIFMENLPDFFKEDWDSRFDAPHMRIQFPATKSIISGEAGDGIGRGDRASFYFIDESAWLPRPEAIDASLSQTTNCRQDISTPHGMNNPFARKRFSGKINVFTFHWKDDPRKDEAWYVKKCHDIDDPVVIAQEIDLDYSASMQGLLIPNMWIQAAVDAHLKLGIKPTGIRRAGFDVADEGSDKDAFCGRYGILVEYLESWSGKNGDIYQSTEKVFTLCDILNYPEFLYDADGLGAGVRGDGKTINKCRDYKIKVFPFHGSGKVIDPEGNPFRLTGEIKDREKGRTNEDFFANAKAQAWWNLRLRFQYTYRAIIEKLPYNPEHIISISSSAIEYRKAIAELSQVTYAQNNVGKIIINKMPEGTRSPNIADSIVIAFSPFQLPSRGVFSVDLFKENFR